MYDITIGLSYNDPLKMNTKYRYDFVGFDFEPKYGNGPLDGGVFVFRTIRDGKAAGSMLVGLIDFSNVNAFDVALHGDAHIHMLNINTIIEQGTFSVTDKIAIQSIKNLSNNIEFLAIIKDQRHELNSDRRAPILIDFKETKYMLFMKYHEDNANMEEYLIAPIFKLQKEHIWCQNRYWNFNDLTKVDIDKNSIEANTPSGTVLEIIKNEREKRFEVEREKFRELLDARNSLHYFPIER